MANVINSSFYLLVKDEECILLQSALTARMHKIHESIMCPQTSKEMREIHRVNYTRLMEMRQRLLATFVDPTSRA